MEDVRVGKDDLFYYKINPNNDLLEDGSRRYIRWIKDGIHGLYGGDLCELLMSFDVRYGRLHVHNVSLDRRYVFIDIVPLGDGNVRYAVIDTEEKKLKIYENENGLVHQTVNGVSLDGYFLTYTDRHFYLYKYAGDGTEVTAHSYELREINRITCMGKKIVCLYKNGNGRYLAVMTRVESPDTFEKIWSHDSLNAVNNQFFIIRVRFATPSMIMFKTSEEIFMLNLNNREMIVERKRKVGDHHLSYLSPDGRILITRRESTNGFKDIFMEPSFSPFLTPYDFGAREIGEIHRSHGVDKDIYVQVHDLRPAIPYVILSPHVNVSFIKAVSPKEIVFQADRDMNTTRNTTVDSYVIGFKHPLPYPIHTEEKPDGSWMRLLSDLTVDSDKSWPALLGKLDFEGRGDTDSVMKKVKEFSFDLWVGVATWVASQELPEDRRPRTYEAAILEFTSMINRMANLMAAEVGLY